MTRDTLLDRIGEYKQRTGHTPDVVAFTFEQWKVCLGDCLGVKITSEKALRRAAAMGPVCGLTVLGVEAPRFYLGVTASHLKEGPAT